MTIGKSKLRSTRERLTITSSSRNKLFSMPSSNRFRSNSKSEHLQTRQQTSHWRPINFTMAMRLIIALVPHHLVSNLLRKLLIHMHRKHSLIRERMPQEPERNVLLASIIHRWSNNQVVSREWIVVVCRTKWLNPLVMIYSLAEYRQVSAVRYARLSRPRVVVAVLWGQDWIHTKLCIKDRPQVVL